MIILETTRHHLSYINTVFQTFVIEFKKSNMIHVVGCSKITVEFLNAKLLNCLLDELEIMFAKKLVNSTGAKIKLKMNDALGIALYRVLLMMPINEKEVYCKMVRDHWILILDGQIGFTPAPKPKFHQSDNRWEHE